MGFEPLYIPKIRFRLGEDDQKLFDRGEEWFTYDHTVVMQRRAGELSRLENAMDYTFGELTRDFLRRGASALRAVMWLARQDAGVKEQWDSFDPHVWTAEWDFVDEPEVDAVPPAEAAE